MFRVMVHTSKMGPARFLVEQGPFCERTATLIDFFFLTYSKYLIHNNSITPSERKKTKLGASNSLILYCYLNNI